jgi:hypothetical protein
MQNMRDLLRGTLGRSLRPLPALDRLAAAWPVACGSALAGHGEIAGYENGVVRVIVLGPEWMQPLSQLKLVLASDLARIAGVPVTAIHFEKAGNSQQETGNRRQKR